MLDELRYQVRTSQNSGNAAELTQKRGRLLKKIDEKIKLLEEKENKSPEDEKELTDLYTEKEFEIHNHKTQLQARYSNEFLNQNGTFSKIFEIPKNCSLSARATIQCIKELKQAKNNRQKIFKGLEALKQAGLTIATPVITLGKIALTNWYIPFAALSVLKLTDTDLFKSIINLTNLKDTNLLEYLDNIRNNKIVSPIYKSFDSMSNTVLEKTDKAMEDISDKVIDEIAKGFHK